MRRRCPLQVCISPEMQSCGGISRLSDDASTNQKRIETWEVLKKELKDQFLPCNTSWVARESLRNLRHTGTFCEFVKEFSSLMLDRQDDSGNGKAKFDKKFKKKEKAKKVVIETSEPRAVEKPRRGCFICGNLEHRARECPKRTGSVAGTVSGVCGVTLQGLMMVAGQINGKEMKALVDMGATNNFISERVVHKLGLDVKPCDSQVKDVNSKAVPISGVANTELRMGSWSGQCDFMAVELDDFDVILGIDFFKTAYVMILPLGGIFISGGNKPKFVRGEYDEDTTAGKKSKMADAGPSMLVHRRKGCIHLILPVFAALGRYMRRCIEDRLRHNRFVDLSLNRSQYFGKEGKQSSYVDEGVDTSWWGWFVKMQSHAASMRMGLDSECRQGSAGGICESRQTGGIVGWCWCHDTGLVDGTWHDAAKLRSSWVIVRAGCTTGGHVGLASAVSVDRYRAYGLESRQCAWADGRQRAQAGTRMGEQTSMCGDVRQAVRTDVDGLGRLADG
ncbi:UNVERIFIED_CONTAM: hypothetical protein Slati_0510700 [Sesamum latifolium]|uniref:CCHC-type domain-containing protein n=1 Tax=Sesamum latifolium TaxID=2727402 RepID=A0AAW2Y0R4_9LAMI